MTINNQMYFTNLYAKNIRQFKELTVEFNPRFNFVTGPNGSGKTSLLRCLSMTMTNHEYEDTRFCEDSVVWSDFVKDGKSYRVGWGRGWIRSVRGYRTSPNYSIIEPDSTIGIKSLSTINLNDIVPEFAPLFIGAFRRLKYKEIKGMSKEIETITARSNYRSSGPNNLNGTHVPDIKQWLINRYFIIDKPWAIIEKENWTWLMRHFASISPAGVEMEFIEIGKDLEPIFKINNNITYLEELSAGFQSILSIIFNIFDWVEAINEGDAMKVENASGSVIIDELDVHLHPEWQLTIRDSLEKLFPQLQFIITTHSPHLLASAKSGEIIALDNNPDEITNIKPLERSYSGWSTDQILEELMGVKSLENKDYSIMVREGLDLIKERKVDELATFINDFEQIAHPEDTLLTTFKFKLAELELTRGE